MRFSSKKKKKKVVITLTVFLAVMLSYFVQPLAEEIHLVEGVHVIADDSSPTGFFVTFVHRNTYATLVELGGDFMLRDIYNLENTEQYYPDQFRPGLFPTGGGGGGRNFREPMEYMGDGFWAITVPLTGGGIAYWYFVTVDETTTRIGDPVNPPPFSPHDVRSVINDQLSVVHVPWSEVQHTLNNRHLEMPFDGLQGSVQYVRFNSSFATGESQLLQMQPETMFGYLMVYLPPNFDPNRAMPYPVVYMSHGVFGDQTDWMGAGSVPHVMDNLIAQGVIEPTVVVSINNSRHATGEGFNPGALFTLNPNPRYDLMQYVIPFVQDTFNVSSEPVDRAIAALSLGAVWAGQVYYYHAGDFGYFAFFSTPSGPTNTSLGELDLANTPNRDFPTMFTGYGIFAAADYQALPQIFEEAGINFVTYQVPGHHDMHTWAQLFTIFAQNYLWQSGNEQDVGVPQLGFPRGVTVLPDQTSPTGFRATFVYYNPAAVLVEFVGLLNLRYIDGGDTVRPVHEFEPGWFHAPGAGGNHIVRMDYIGDGYWTTSAPVAGGTINYWFQLYTEQSLDGANIPAEISAEFRAEHSVRIVDPYNTLSNLLINAPQGVGNFRYSLIHVPFDPARQHILNDRNIELPRTDRQGTLDFVRYYDGDEPRYMGVYLPYGYDPNRSEPFPVIFTAHGMGGDLTDWLWQVNAPNTLDNLIADGVIPPTALITSSQIPFGFDPPFGQLRHDIVDNIMNNVVPFAEQTFNISVNPSERALVGLSMGTSVVAHIFYEHTDFFGYYAFISGGHMADLDFSSIPWQEPTILMGHGLFEFGSNLLFPQLPDLEQRYIHVVPSGYGAHIFSIFARDYLWSSQNEIEMVPIRANAENAGAVVSWTAETGTVTIDINGSITSFSVNEPLPGGFGTSELINGVTFVPRGFLDMLFE
ncbi:MAG: alpha/beta hydrolase-fold protein [Defluviitaleaceae bacterium]|nr:alpha/beta hydrolase-fold protein [Defluviitaleaceae bacterium]